MILYKDFTNVCSAEGLDPVDIERITGGGDGFLLLDLSSRVRELVSADVISPLLCDVNEAKIIERRYKELLEPEVSGLRKYIQTNNKYVPLVKDKPYTLDDLSQELIAEGAETYGIAYMPWHPVGVSTVEGSRTIHRPDTALIWRLEYGAGLAIETSYYGALYARGFGTSEQMAAG